MKRRDLLQHLAQIVKREGLTLEVTEGGSHTKVRIGTRVNVVPRHTEINEMTARAILKKMED